MIRDAVTADAPRIAALLADLGYPTDTAAVEERLRALTDADAVLIADGVATALLAAAEQRAREWGCDLLEVSSGRRPERDPAHALYRAAGFADTGERSMRYWKRLDTGH